MTPAFRLNETTGEDEATRPLAQNDILDQAKTILSEKLLRSSEPLTNPDDTKDFLIAHMAELEHEVFAVIFLDNRHRVISFRRMFRGTIDGASVHPREVVKACLQCNGAAVILSHCHPSGVAEPSRADEALTQRLKDALSLIDVRILGHIIVGGTETVSFAERGIL